MKDSKLSKYTFTLVPENEDYIIVLVFKDGKKCISQERWYTRGYNYNKDRRYVPSETDTEFCDRVYRCAKEHLRTLDSEQKRFQSLKETCSSGIHFDVEGKVVK